MTRSAAATARSARATATIRDSINPTTVQNLENAVNATARTIRKSNATAAKAALKAETEAAAKAVAEKVTVKAVRKPRAKVASEVTPANKVRLANAAKKVAIRLLQDFFAQTDEARAELAEPKAMAAVKIANERAVAAGMEIPFADRESMGFGSEDADRDAAQEMEEEIAREENEKMLAEDAAKVAEKHLDAFGAVKLSPRQKALMAAIGNREFSFFDEGIVADSGIWHSCMTGECAGPDSPIATTPKGVANVIAALGRKGLLEIGDLDEGDVWVNLTASGASLALSLANGAPAEKADAPKAKVEKAAKVEKVTKAATIKAEKAAIAADPALNPKVIALAAYAVSMGWVTETTVDAPSVVVVSERDAEKLTVTFIDGKMDLMNKPSYCRADGSVVLLRNVSAVKMQMNSDAAARPVKSVKMISKKVARIDGAEKADAPIKSLPFDPREVSDEELAATLAGATITWKRADGATETAIVGKKVTVKNHPVRSGKSSRVISFFEMVDGDKGPQSGGQRSIGLDRLLTVGK